MAKGSSPAIKVIDGSGGSNKLLAVVGTVAGVVAGAGATRALFQRRSAPGASKGTLGVDTVGTVDTVEPQPGDTQSDPIGPFDHDAAGIEPGKEKGPKGRLISLGQKRGWRWLGRTLQVQNRYGELQGSNLAASVTLQLFLSIFPLLLIASAVVGFVVHNGSGDVTNRIIDATGLTGSTAEDLRKALQTAQESRRSGSIVGFLTLLWSALGVSSALQYAYNQSWQSSSRGIKDKAIGLGWMSGAAILFAASALVSTALNWLPAGLGPVGVLLGMAITFVLWMFTAKVLPNVHVTWKSTIPGAILGAIGLEVLKVLGAVYVPHAISSSSGVYGAAGIVLAVLAFVLLFGKLVVYSAVLNVVMYEGKHGVTKATIEMPGPAAPGAAGATRSGQSDK